MIWEICDPHTCTTVTGASTGGGCNRFNSLVITDVLNSSCAALNDVECECDDNSLNGGGAGRGRSITDD